MKLNYIKVNPTENMTVFILDPLPRADHAPIARKILDYGCLHAEQVGFIESPASSTAGIRLQMMGGEFCGNATRALAAIAVSRGYPCAKPVAEGHSVVLEVSGVPNPLKCTVSPAHSGSYDVSLELPRFESIEPISIQSGDRKLSAVHVRFPGISHVVLRTTEISVPEDFVQSVCDALPAPCTDALGIMLFDPERQFLTPIVYTPDTASLVMERGCGSGTAAVAAALAHLEKHSVDMDIEQPGGTLNITADWANSSVTRIVLAGPVTIVSEGTVDC